MDFRNFRLGLRRALTFHDEQTSWTGLREVLLTDVNGVLIATGAKYPRSVNWRSIASQARDEGTAVLPGNHPILYQENAAYLTNPPEVFVGFPPKSIVLTVYDQFALGGLLTQGNSSQIEQYAFALENPHVFNLVDLRVDPLSGQTVLVNPGAYFRTSAPRVLQYLTVATAVDLSSLITSLTGIQHQLACVFLNRETGVLGILGSVAVNSVRGYVPYRAELDTLATAQSIVLSANQKALGYVYLYSAQTTISQSDIFDDLDPRFSVEELEAYIPGPGTVADGDFVQFNGTTGTLVKDGGLSLTTDGTLGANSDSLIPSEKAVKTYVDAGVAAGIHLTIVPFTYTSVSPFLIRTVDLNEFIDRVSIVIDTAFDGTVTLAVGEIGATNRLLNSSENIPSQPNDYEVAPNYSYPASSNVNLYLTVAGATQGTGRVIMLSKG